MKGLWRAVIWFFLPGMLVAGILVNGVARLLNLGDDTLLLLAGSGIVGLVAAGVAQRVVWRVRHPGRRYYEAAGVLLAALGIENVLPGRLLSGDLSFALFELILSAGVAVFMLNGLVGSGEFTARDRRLWAWGGAAYGVIAVAAVLSGAAQLLFPALSWLAVLLGIAWLAASPLSRRGVPRQRWTWRWVLILAVGGRMASTPAYLPPPERLAERENEHWRWFSTVNTVDGLRYLWSDADGDGGFFTPTGRAVMRLTGDGEYLPSIPGLLGALPRAMPAVLFVGNPGSLWPDAFIGTGLYADFRYWRVPETLRFWRRGDAAFAPSWTPATAGADDSFDLIVMMALPERQYQVRLERLMNQLLAHLRPDGLLAVPETLLDQPVIFGLLCDRFPYSGMLPGAGRMRVFGMSQAVLAPTALDRRLDMLYGADSPLPRGTYELLFSTMKPVENEIPDGQFERLTLGNYDLMGCRAPWYVWVELVLLLVSWRLARLLLERRGMGYRLWNSAENGFAWFWLIGLIVIAGVAVEGIGPLLLLALLPLGFMVSCNLASGGAFWGIIGLALLGMATWFGDVDSWLICAGAVWVQSSLLTGRILFGGTADGRERRRLLGALLLGGLLALILLPVALRQEWPLLLLFVLGVAARVPVVWQKRARHAILSQTKG